MRLRNALVAALLALSAAPAAAVDLPVPVLQFDGTEEYQAGGKPFVRYKWSVVNRADYANELFAPAPDLPPCGANRNASRTWVNIHDGERAGAAIYGFCALKSSDELGKLWFALPKDKTPPRTITVTITDRRANVKVTSARVPIPGERATPVPATDVWKDCQSKDLDVALRACTQITEARNEPPARRAQAHSMRAFAYQGSNRFDEAIADFGQAIELMQAAGMSGWELAFSIFVRANAYRAKGDLERAIEDYSWSIRVAPGWDKAYNERGAIYFQKGEFERALEDISKVISFRPDSPRVADAYALRGMVHYRMGQPAKGLPDADRSLELRARSALALYVRARIYEALGRKDDAEAGFRAAAEIDPKVKEWMTGLEGPATKP